MTQTSADSPQKGRPRMAVPTPDQTAAASGAGRTFRPGDIPAEGAHAYVYFEREDGGAFSPSWHVALRP